MIETRASTELKSGPFKFLNDSQSGRRVLERNSKQAELRRYFGDETYRGIQELCRHARRQVPLTIQSGL